MEENEFRQRDDRRVPQILKANHALHLRRAADPGYGTFEDRLAEVYHAIDAEKKYCEMTGEERIVQ